MAASRAVVVIALISLASPMPGESWGLNGGDFCGPDYAPRYLTEHGQQNKHVLCKLINAWNGKLNGKPLTPEAVVAVVSDCMTPTGKLIVSPGSAQFAHGGLQKYFGEFEGTNKENAGIFMAGTPGMMMENVNVEYIGVVTEENGEVLDVVFTYDMHAPDGVDVPPLKQAYQFGRAEFTKDNKIDSFTIIKNTLWIQKVWDAMHPNDAVMMLDESAGPVENPWQERAALARSEKAPKHLCGKDYDPRQFTLFGAENKLTVCKILKSFEGEDLQGKELTPALIQKEFGEIFADQVTFTHWPNTKDLFATGGQYFGSFTGPAMKVWGEALIPGLRYSNIKVLNMAVVTELRGTTILALATCDVEAGNGAPKVEGEYIAGRYSFDGDGKIMGMQLFDNPMYLNAVLEFEASESAKALVQLEAPSFNLSNAGFFAMGMFSMGLIMVAYTKLGRKVTSEGASYEALVA